MTTEVTNSYTPEQQALALAALERYGLRPTLRFLAEVWGNSPAHETLLRWRRNKVAEVDDSHREFWADYDRSVQAEVKARVAPLFQRMSDTIEHQLEYPDDMERMSKVQGLTISMGILYDKVFPQAKPGFGGGINVGDNSQVVLQVVLGADPDAEARPPMREV